MSRCGHEGVFCLTLIAVIACFTVILTNVFIDIDGLLAAHLKAIPDPTNNVKNDNEIKKTEKVKKIINSNHDNEKVIPEVKSFNVKKMYNNYHDEDDDYYRTKRSSDFTKPKFNVQNPKIKNIITSRLTSLLEELDSEEAKGTSTQKPEEQEVNNEETKQQDREENEKKLQEKRIRDLMKITRRTGINQKYFKEIHDKIDAGRFGTLSDYYKELLRLALQNLLISGIINHLDLRDIYREVHSLVEDFNEMKKNTEARDANNNWKQPKYDSESEVRKEQSGSNEINEFLDELSKYVIKKKKDKKSKEKKKKIFINATIDIITNDKENLTLKSSDIKGNLKINYNGIPVQLKNSTDMSVNKKQQNSNSQNFTYIHEFLQKYAKMYNKDQDVMLIPTYMKTVRKYQAKRMKRHVMVHLNDKKALPNIEYVKKHKNYAKNNDDDSVSVEINTHFNNKGSNVEKKKKLIGTIIEKIAQVIAHSSLDYKNDLKGKTRNPINHWTIKRRAQNPLEVKNDHHRPDYFSVYNPIPVNPHSKRPNFNKVLEPHKHSILRLSRISRQKQDKPKIFSKSKAINSAETGKVDVQYDTVSSSNGIPQRLQKPLTSDNIDSTKDNAFSNRHNVKFLIKNIDGSGFSIGINQFTDLPPDPESMQIFTAIESLIKAYQQKYDVTDEENESLNHKDDVITFEHSHSISKRDAGEQLLKTNGKLNNAFKNLIERVSRKPGSKTNNAVIKNVTQINSTSKKDILWNDNSFSNKIFEKNLEPSEQFNLTSLINRKARSVERSVPYSMYPRQKSYNNNRNNKISTNRFMLTKPIKYYKQVYLKNKRNKRQISFLNELQRDRENGILVVSDEDETADREVSSNREKNDEIDAIINENDNLDSYRKFNENEDSGYNFLINRRRHNKMMSKYPHIFYDNSEKFLRDDPENFPSQYYETKNDDSKLHEQPSKEYGNVSDKSVYLQQLVHAISPSISKENYKVTIKIKPFNKNNSTGDVTGFKQIHTSINKSFNRNGINFVHSFNVSELSRIEKAGENSSSGTVNKEKYNNIENIPSENKDERKGSSNTAHFQSNDPLKTPTLTNKEQQILIANRRDNALDNNHQYFAMETKTNNLYAKSDVNMNDGLLDITLPSNPPKLLRLNREEVSKIVSSTLAKLQDIPNFNEFKERFSKEHTTTIITTTPTATTTDSATSATTARPQIPKGEFVLAKIIGYNVQLTNEILKRIDSNTDMLSTFLEKLDTTIIKPAHKANTPDQQENNNRNQNNKRANQNRPIVKKHKEKVLVYGFQHPHFIIDKKVKTILCRRKPEATKLYYKDPTQYINPQVFVANRTRYDGSEMMDFDTQNIGNDNIAMPTADNASFGNNMTDIEDGFSNK